MSAFSVGLENRHKNRDRITLVILSYASPALLLTHLETVRSYPDETRRTLEVLVVDDGSPSGLDATSFVTARHAEGFHSFRVATITEDLAWNIGGARNLAFHLAATKRVLLLDADIVFSPVMMNVAMALPQRGKTKTKNVSVPLVHKFNRKNPSGQFKAHPAAILIHVDQYWQAGGCDEDFVGSYGFTDVHFNHHLWELQKAERLAIRYNPQIVLKELNHTIHVTILRCPGTRRSVTAAGLLQPMRYTQSSRATLCPTGASMTRN